MIDQNRVMKDKSIHQPLQIFCGQGGSAQFSIPDTTPATVGLVTVNGREGCKAQVKIKFSSVVNLTSTDDDSQTLLTFNLFRVCDQGEALLLDTWTYEASLIENAFEIIGLTKSFSFIYCDYLNYSKVCEYFVSVSADNIVNATVSIDNVQIQAITHDTLLFCGEGTSASFNGNNQTQPIIPTPSSASLGQVTVNTKGLSKPVVEVEFSSIVNLLAGDDDAKASLNFMLFRDCGDEEPVLVNNWIYEVFLIEDFLDIRLSTSYNFIFCERLSNAECCDYFVEVSVGGLDEINTISITDVHIAALVGESEKTEESTLLACGQSMNANFVNLDIPPIPVGRVKIDTNNLYKPVVSIEFSSIVSYLATEDDAQGRLKFELFRVCDNGKPVLLNNWAFEAKRIDNAFENTRWIDAYEFNFCDDADCSGCCEYFVQVSIENLLTANLMIDNVQISALVGDHVY
ncbi:DUF4489 domain-containing protein [Vallitalea okinawensis]|uniref:DUF4489 domain-containing protein n=1 Tax=Vallitalea okinawensis TaxID=2078660 RepID=UPI000CFA9C39|nr:DUF4489 domain-containing protein [Vallitalea okinawensis]